VRLCEFETFACVLGVFLTAFYLLRTAYARLKTVCYLFFCCFAEARRLRTFSRSIRIFRTLRTGPGESGLLSTRFLLSLVECIICHEHFTLYSVAHHKHPTIVIPSCLFVVQDIGPNRTFDIQNQNAHIKWEYYKSFKYSLFISYMT
jgi:hypothetical protein